jgi:replicative DNA helicase
METKQETFQKFGKNFQENLCHLMLQDRTFCDQISEVIDVEFIQYEHLRIFVKMLTDYRTKYRQHPSYETMATIITSEVVNYTDALKKQLTQFYAKVINNSDIESTDFIKDHAIDFCRKQVLKKAMIQSVHLLKSSSFEEIQKVIEEAMKLGTNVDFGHDWHMDIDDRYRVKTRNPITTGFARFDEITQGGFGQSELGVVIAPTGAGKSMALVHIGATALKESKTVIYYTLELAEGVVGQRFDSCITDIKLNDLLRNKFNVIEKLKEINGHLIIKEYPSKSASTQTIRSHIERLKKRGIKPDMIIVDYADLLKPVKSQGEKRHELESIYEELRGVAQREKCAVITASQTNRGGLNAEVITMESISEAFSKCFVADFIFSLSRTPQDKQANTGRVFIAKNRNGPDGLVFPIFADWSNVTMKVLEKSSNEEDKPEMSSKDNLRFLKQKYAQTRSK